ncbi:MAG: hypothetical protein DRJ42_05955, partial [Deltaproteobacteria bacterium]
MAAKSSRPPRAERGDEPTSRSFEIPNTLHDVEGPPSEVLAQHSEVGDTLGHLDDTQLISTVNDIETDTHEAPDPPYSDDDPQTVVDPDAAVAPEYLDHFFSSLSTENRTRPIVAPDAAVGPTDFDNRYERIGPLGEGGMGEIVVYLDRQLGREVAVKTIRAETSSSEQAQRRFLAEARVQGQLEHPAIVPVYDIGTDGAGRHFFTMPWIHGVSLEEVLQRLAAGDQTATQRFSRRRLVSALGTICLALDFAHRRGVIHRDLKPANIMLGEFGEVHLLDWGVAKVTGSDALSERPPPLTVGQDVSNTLPGTILGTLGYMPPEQIRGAGSQLTPAADVYAIGAMLFEICTLERLHPGETMGEISLSTLGDVEARPSVRVPNAKVPSLLEEIIVRAVAKDVDQRFGSARALYRALEAYLDDERDDEHRMDLAIGHARAAKRALRRADRDVDERRRAIREVGRALALDPDNGFAAQSLRALLD